MAEPQRSKGQESICVSRAPAHISLLTVNRQTCSEMLERLSLYVIHSVGDSSMRWYRVSCLPDWRRLWIEVRLKEVLIAELAAGYEVSRVLQCAHVTE